MKKRNINYISGLGATGRFPPVDASDEECRRFMALACKALPEAMLGRLFRRESAFLWVTKYADGLITAETSDRFAEPSVAEQFWQKPAPGEIPVILATAR